MVMEGKSSYCCDNPPPPPFLINEDCLIQILLWLPVISLLRFKSVCKSWRAIIQNPFFIHTHATTTTTTTTNKVVLLRRSYYPRVGVGEICTVSGDEFEVLEDLGIPGPEFDVLVDGCEYYRYINITMAGCCNGIICLHDQGYNTRFPPNVFLYSTITLWNPAIKQYTYLPIPFALEEKNHDGEYVDYFVDQGLDISAHTVEHVVGFGFDVKTKDYKVLLITYDIYALREYYHARGVQVYSLSTDSWRCIDASDALPNLIIRWEDRDQGHYLNGTYLFVSRYYLYEEEEEGDEFQEPTTNSRQECYKPVIMSFDFTEENFRTIQLPFDFKSETETRNHAHMILFGEKIAVTNVCEEFQLLTYRFDIWVLSEYGGSESWSKFYSFVSSNDGPKFITDNGDFILLDAFQDPPKLKLLNVVTEEIKDIQYDCEDPSDGSGFNVNRVGVYKPSLIPITTGNGATDTCLQV